MQPIIRRGRPSEGRLGPVRLALVLLLPLLLLTTIPALPPHSAVPAPSALRSIAPPIGNAPEIAVGPTEAIHASPSSVATPSTITILKLGAKPTAGNLPLTVEFNASANSSTDKAAKFTFVWNYSDNTPLAWVNVSGVAGIPVEAFSNHTFTTVGSYSVRVNVSDNVGDAPLLSHQTIITVNPAPITLTAVTANRTGGAIPFSTQFTTTAKSVQNRAATYTFDWFFDDGTPNATDVRTAVAGGSAVSFLNHTYTALGAYNARVNVTDNLTGDTYTLSHLIAILTTPPLRTWANATDTQFTLGGSVELLTGIAGGLGPYRATWTATPPGCSASALDMNCTPTLVGTFNIRVTVTDAVGNKNFSTINITVFAAIVLVGHYASFFACEGSIGVLEGNFTAAATYGEAPLYYNWTFGDGSAPAPGWNVTHQFDTTGNFTVIVWVNDSGGGKANYTLVVPATFSSCGTVPPPSFAPSQRLLEVAAGVLVILIVILAVLILRTPSRPAPPPPMVPVATESYTEGPSTVESPPVEAAPDPTPE